MLITNHKYFCTMLLHHSSTSSAFPAISLGFTILLLLLPSQLFTLGFIILLLLPSQLYLWASPFFFCLPSYISWLHHSSSSSAFPAIYSGFHHSSSSAFPAISLGFTILLLLPSKLYLWASSFVFCLPSYIYLWASSFFSFCLPSYISGLHHSSSSAFPAISLGFTILGEIFACDGF